MKLIYCLFFLLVTCQAAPIYLISWERQWNNLEEEIQNKLTDAAKKERVFGLTMWEEYEWSYDELDAALYARCGGNLEHIGQVDYYDKKYNNAFYIYIVKEKTEFYCDLTNRLVVKTGSILDGCKGPETWYYKVPILDKEEDN
jgi:hypothetical protein